MHASVHWGTYVMNLSDLRPSSAAPHRQEGSKTWRLELELYVHIRSRFRYTYSWPWCVTSQTLRP